MLRDTLILHVLPPYRHANRRKLAATDKVYFFDIGVANALAGRRDVQPGTAEYGLALEQLVFLELRAALDYGRLDTKLTCWRTRTGVEVDFLLDDHTAVEVKATRHVSSRDLRSLRVLAEELGPCRGGSWSAVSPMRGRPTTVSKSCRSNPSASGCGTVSCSDRTLSAAPSN